MNSVCNSLDLLRFDINDIQRENVSLADNFRRYNNYCNLMQYTTKRFLLHNSRWPVAGNDDNGDITSN